MLVEKRQPFDRSCSRRWSRTVGLVLAMMVAAIATYRGEADDKPAESNQDKDGKASQTQRGYKERPRTEAAPAASRKERLRYSGRTFEQWREQLLDDLDPKTIAEAMQPITAFGRSGYAAEAVAALSEVMLAERPIDDGGFFAAQAAGALARIGDQAAPALIEGLADRRPAVRGACAQAIGALGAAGQPATDALVKLLADEAKSVRFGAMASLVVVAGDNDDLRPVFERLAESDETETRDAFVANVGSRPPKGNWWVDLFLQLAEDEVTDIRARVGVTLAKHGPAEKRVIRVLEDLIVDKEERVSVETLDAVVKGGKPAALVMVLTDALERPDIWNRFATQSQLEEAIERLSRAPDQAAATVPLLTRIVDLKAPAWGYSDLLAAMDGLGRLGPAAKSAIPALQRWVAGDIAADEVEKKHAYRALKKIRGPAP